MISRRKFSIKKRGDSWIGKSPFGLFFHFNSHHDAIFFCDRIMRSLTVQSEDDIMWADRILQEFIDLYRQSKLELMEK